MVSPATAPSRNIRHAVPKSRRRKLIAAIAIAGIVACLGLVLFPRTWPFTRKSILQNLGEAADSTVTAQKYHATYFPPGCVLDGVELRHHGAQFITIQKLIFTANYLGILRRHVHRVEAIGAYVYLPEIGSNPTFRTQHSNTVIDELVANAAYVAFASRPPRNNPFHFDVHEATLRNVRWNGAIVYHLKFHNPNPPGEISTDGQFGAWTEGHPEETPFSGRYTFEHADLSYYGGIAGLLSSQGQFHGALQHLNVNGATDIPDFEVKSSGNHTQLTTRFNAYVNAMNGDTYLQRVEARLGHTALVAEGSVAHSPGSHGKLAGFHLTANDGRIEDILGLFVTGPSPMSGTASLQAQAAIPPGSDPFQEKVQLQGEFRIDEGRFAERKKQRDVDELSAGARGKNKTAPPTVLTDLSGKVNLQKGTAHFSDLSFTIPGAGAHMHGTYSILNYRINLHGRMRVDTRISKTSSGMKSLFLKLLDPLFRKRKKGEVVPIHIEGTYHNPQFGLDLTNKDSSKKH